jgi:acid phosphatase (class A)
VDLEVIAMVHRWYSRLFVLALFLPGPILWAQGIEAPAHVSSGRFLDPEAIDVAKVLPAPPEPGSLAALADLEAVRMAQAWRTPEQVAWAEKVEKEDLFDFADVLGTWFTKKNLPRCAGLLNDVLKDLNPASRRAKDRFQRPRPPKVDSSIKPCVFLPWTNSYPSGHALRAFAEALVLSEVFPERREALLARAHRAGWGRIQGGVHFPSDVVGGRLLAEAAVAEMKKSPVFREAVAACRKEADALKK